MERYQGLIESEVLDLRKRYGYNELPTQRPKSFWDTLIHVFQEPMILLLFVGGAVYLLLGEPKDSLALMVTVFVVIGITLFQERKTEKAIQALKDLSSPRALVIRNGIQVRIAGNEVVPGDILLLQEGDRVPADAVILDSLNLFADESLLTGESLPVQKYVWEGTTSMTIPTGMGAHHAFSGTLIAQGSGTARVISIGSNTKMGKIGKTMISIQEEEFLLKKEVSRVVKIFGIFGLTACIAVFAINFYIDRNLLNSFLSGLTLSMAMLPEEFPVVLLIFLTLGAWRISKKQVLTRNNQAIETLGATTVLCVDKTGTLTFNHMDLVSLTSIEKGTLDFSFATKFVEGVFADILYFAKLASKRHAFDPLEIELNEKFERYVAQGENIIQDWHLLKEYPLSKDLFAISRVWRSPGSSHYIVSAKGSPEAIMDMCKLSDTKKKKGMEKVFELAQKGQRVLGVAKAEFFKDSFPESQIDFKFEFLGFIGFVDDIRPNVVESVKECYDAGMRVIMITGDYPGTAQYIAAKAGLKNIDKYITGEELESLSGADLRGRIKDVNIFARVVPEQKLLIIDALKANGEIVAMTGDGVNDGPALKAAHIGIAMGDRGTDVAREAADLVLINDDFTSIVSAVKLGRRIYDNLQKAVAYILSIHIPIAGVALLPTIFGMPTVLYPIHIAFFELIIDPACSTVYEGEHSEDGIMKRKPRGLTDPLFGRANIFISLLQGLILLSVIMVAFYISLRNGDTEWTARSVAFITMVLCNLSLIYADLSQDSVFVRPRIHKNKPLYLITAFVLSSILLITKVPFLMVIFHFSPLSVFNMKLVISLVLFCYASLEALKLVGGNRVLNR